MLSVLLQRYIPINTDFFHSLSAKILGMILIMAGLIFSAPAIIQFIKSKNTVVTAKAATSLQTSGIYSVSRNPLYTGLMLEYLGLACFIGNWWNIILLPVLILLVINLIILPEEKYLLRAFGNSYTEYKKNVRRWI
jgi:protein-S-isoprenylcysteine O-methyltransferase Ste14